MEPRSKTQDRTATICNNLFDASVWGALVVAPLFMGGRGPFGRYVLVTFVALMALAWCIKTVAAKSWKFHLTGGEWILILGLGLLCLQITPLPEHVLLSLSPGHRELLPMWFSSAETSHLQIGQWDTLSFAPNQTREAMGIYLTLACFFVLLTQRIESLDDIRGILNKMSMATVTLAILALCQYFWSNGKYLWIYEHPTRSTNLFVTGTFQNKNHFAHMMALGLGPLIWCAVSTWNVHVSPGRNRELTRKSSRNSAKSFAGVTQQDQHISYLHLFSKAAFALAIPAVILATLLTFSRGGIMATSIAGASYLGLAIVKRSSFRNRTPSWIPIAAGILLGIGVVSAIAAYRFIASSENTTAVDQLSGGRIALWQSMLKASESFWLTGTGIGSHVDVYPIHMDKVYSARFSHGESGYIPLLMEGGITALILLACVVWFAPGRLLRYFLSRPASITNGRNQAVMLAAPVLAGLMASLVQSIGDFVWYITACMSWTIALLAIACRLPYLMTANSPSDDNARISPALHQGWLNRLLAVAQPATFRLSRPYIAYAILSLNVIAMSMLYRPAIASLNWENYRKIAKDAERWSDDQATEKIDLLKRTLKLNPHHRQAATMLAQIGWKHQKNSFANTSTQAQNAHQDLENAAKLLAMRLVQDYPLQGRGYVFLLPEESESHQVELARALLEQARTVRPKDPIVLMIVGKRLLSAGKHDEGFACWRFAFNHDDDVRHTLINYMAPLFHPEIIVEKVQPNDQALWDLLESYQASSDEVGINTITYHLIERLSNKVSSPSLSNEALARLYFQLHSLFRIVGSEEQAHDVVNQAVRKQPENYVYRYNYALSCFRLRRYDDALKEVAWCVSERPYDSNLKNLMATIERQRLVANSSSTGGLKRSH